MKRLKNAKTRIARLSDVLLPAALFLSVLLGRGDAALRLFAALTAVRLLSLSTASGLRNTFARQPSMRYVQGSALLALPLQCAGALLCYVLSRFFCRDGGWLPFIACGLTLNIEHVFYEYLYAVGDGGSVTLSRSITAALTLVGLLLYTPSGAPTPLSVARLLIPVCVSTLASAAVSASLGGRLRPRINGAVLRTSAPSMLQTALYPALAVAICALLKSWPQTPVPLFAGQALYELCRSPFRRGPAEAKPLYRGLLAACAASALIALPFLAGWVSPLEPLLRDIPWACGAIALAAVCAAALYGSIPTKGNAFSD